MSETIATSTARTELRSAAFRRERQASWLELSRLLSRADRGGVQRLSPLEISRLPVLYRAAVASLSVARSMVLDRGLETYLESLVARSHVVVHSPRRRLFRGLWEFFRESFPGLVRETGRFHGLAAIALGVGVLAGMAATSREPDLFLTFVSESMAAGRNPSSSTETLRASLYYGEGDMESAGLGNFASFLFTNNSGVGLLAFSLGFLGGVPVLLLLFINGMTLGAMSALFQMRGLSLEWWAWILPHGVTELLAIVLCGGAGLAVSEALIFPGLRSRTAELAHRGRRAGGITLGCMFLFLVAGLIEGFFRQLVHAVPIRALVAVLTLIFWSLYFRLAGQRVST